MIIKENAELRHALAHLCLAVEALAEGRPGSALDDLGSIEGLIFYESDKELERLRAPGGKGMACKKKRGKGGGGKGR